MVMKKLTPVLFVERIEPSLDFWVRRLGFTQTVEVPEGDRLGFVILVKDTVEVMLQSRASVSKDVPALLPESRSPSFLYMEVENLDEIIAKVAGMEVVIPRRTTFYGATEIAVRDPGGHVVCFAMVAAMAAQ